MGERGVLLPGEAAEYLATSERHLRRLVARDGLRVVRMGGKRRFRREDLDDYIAKSVADGMNVPLKATA